VDDLHDPEFLRSVGFPDGVYAMNVDPDRSRLLYRYLTDPGIYRSGQVTEWIVVSEEGEILSRLQEEVRREVGRRGIIVEVNPSSNLLIGNFGDLKRHPFWRLAGPPGSDSSVAPITVCIGSDDPITFATDIRHEYQLVYDSLISAGRSAEEALTWIARVRESSLSVKFTLPSSTKPTHRSG
jgi:hypothetical protein